MDSNRKARTEGSIHGQHWVPSAVVNSTDLWPTPNPTGALRVCAATLRIVCERHEPAAWADILGSSTHRDEDPFVPGQYVTDQQAPTLERRVRAWQRTRRQLAAEKR
jgi:hypothetical protein